MTKKAKILIFSCIAMILTYMPWYNYSAVLPLLRAEFGFSSADAGTILSAFQVGYFLVVLLAGWLSDQVGRKVVLVVSSLFMGLASTAFALFAKGFTSALMLRVLVGMGAGGIYVPGMAILSNWFPPSERGMAIGAYTGALTAAYAGAYYVAAPLAAAYSWRVGILATSLTCFVGALIYLVLVGERPPAGAQESSPVNDGPPGQRPGAATKQPQENGVPASKGFFRNAPAVLITVGYVGHMWELYAFWGWVGPFVVAASTAVGVGKDQAVSMGGTIAATMILMGAVSSWVGGYAADRIGRTLSISIFMAVSITCSLVFGWLYGLPLAVIIVVGMIYGFFVVGDSAIFKAGLTELVHPSVRSYSLGLQSAIGYAATIISPAVFGYILDATNKAGQAPKIWGPAFAVLGLGGFLAPIAMVFLRRNPQARVMAGGKR